MVQAVDRLSLRLTRQATRHLTPPLILQVNPCGLSCQYPAKGFHLKP